MMRTARPVCRERNAIPAVKSTTGGTDYLSVIFIFLPLELWYLSEYGIFMFAAKVVIYMKKCFREKTWRSAG